MNNLDLQYLELLRHLIYNGVKKVTRNGTTLSTFGRMIVHKMSEGFPLLTTKKMAIKSVMTELKWFLKGDTNIRYLNENGCKIWNGDAYKVYERTCLWELEDPKYTQEEFIQKIMEDDEFNRVWGELGPIYGKQWRKWSFPEVNGYFGPIDQIKILIQSLKTNPDSRRLMVNAWNVGELHQMTLPPCHYGFQVYTRELTARERTAIGSKGSTKLYDSIKEGGYKTIDADVEMHKVCDDANVPKRAISLMWNQRSVDSFLGLPFNIASYGMLLHLLAKEVNMVPDELVGSLGDVHLYEDHIEQAKEQMWRDSYELPTLELGEVDILNGEFEYEIKNYKSQPAIKAPLLT